MRRRRRPTLHHAVKDKRVTVLGPVKQPEMDFMSHRGAAKSLAAPKYGVVTSPVPPVLLPPPSPATHCATAGTVCCSWGAASVSLQMQAHGVGQQRREASAAAPQRLRHSLRLGPATTALCPSALFRALVFCNGDVWRLQRHIARSDTGHYSPRGRCGGGRYPRGAGEALRGQRLDRRRVVLRKAAALPALQICHDGR